jgi:hypothetical protein
MSSRRRFLRASVVALVLISGCAGLEATPATGLAGAWEGRSAGAGGAAPVRLVVKEDGTYLGTLTTAGEERILRGAIVELSPGRLRWSGNQGDGSVTVMTREGRRVLRFQRDDGGGVMEISERAP